MFIAGRGRLLHTKVPCISTHRIFSQCFSVSVNPKNNDSGSNVVPAPILITSSQASQLNNIMRHSAVSPDSPKLVFVDGSYHMNKDRKARQEYLDSHIPNARYFDIDSVCDKSIPLPHMVPTENEWAAAMDAMGIRRQDHVVVYTHAGAMSGPRVWYLFTAFGHPKVSLLNGGIAGWKAAGNPVSSQTEVEAQSTLAKHAYDAANASPGGYKGAKLQRYLVASKKEVKQAMLTGKAQILDARSAARFQGQVAEPREGLVSGCIPGSLNIPYTEFISDGDTTKFKTKKEIRDVFDAAGKCPERFCL